MSKNRFKINNELKRVFSEQIQKRKEELGYKTVDDFINALAEKYSFKYSAVRSWYYGSTLPDIGKLYDLCDFLDCDIDYLFGRIECSTRAYQQIKDESNLSEESIKWLQRDIPVPLIKKTLFPTKPIKPLAAAVNYLLMTEHGRNFLRYIFDYIHSDSLSFSYQGKNIADDIEITNKQSNNSYKLSPQKYDSVILGQIQKELILLKHTENKIDC